MSNELTLDQYQELTQRTAIYPGQGGLLGLNYAAMEAAGEAGEIANKVKKISRDTYRERFNDLDSIKYAEVETSTVQVMEGLGILLGSDLAGEYMTDEQKKAIAKEVGGALYGLARVASELGVTLGEIAQQNLDILASRKERNVLGGQGDDR